LDAVYFNFMLTCFGDNVDDCVGFVAQKNQTEVNWVTISDEPDPLMM